MRSRQLCEHRCYLKQRPSLYHLCGWNLFFNRQCLNLHASERLRGGYLCEHRCNLKQRPCLYRVRRGYVFIWHQCGKL